MLTREASFPRRGMAVMLRRPERFRFRVFALIRRTMLRAWSALYDSAEQLLGLSSDDQCRAEIRAQIEGPTCQKPQADQLADRCYIRVMRLNGASFRLRLLILFVDIEREIEVHEGAGVGSDLYHHLSERVVRSVIPW